MRPLCWARLVQRQFVCLGQFGIFGLRDRLVASGRQNRGCEAVRAAEKLTTTTPLVARGDVLSDVRSYVDELGVEAEFLQHASPELRDISKVKSIVCSAAGRTVLLILLVDDLIDFRKAAAALGARSSKLRLANPAEVAETGFQIGAVPPFGHLQQLPTLVDRRVLEHARVSAGSGHPDESLALTTAALVYASTATVCDFRRSQPGTPEASGEASDPQHLPSPWRPGAERVQLLGRAVALRRLGDCFLFADVVPLEASVLPTENASSLRHLWRHPGNGQPAKLQMVVGATMERRLGSSALKDLLNQVKIGTAVLVEGEPAAPKPGSGPQLQGELEVICSDLRIVEAADLHTMPPVAGDHKPPLDPPRPPPAEPRLPVFSMDPASICVVDSLELLAEMDVHIFQGSHEPQELGGEAEVGRSSHSFRLVGLDAEWQPSGSFSPVTLLQISTRRRAFLVDMMWFCTAAPLGWSAEGGELPQLSAKEATLSAFLTRLFSSADIVKAGFAFKGDMTYLCRSFPHLPCFQASEGGGECQVAAHVDVKQLALKLLPPTPGVTKFVGLAALVRALLGCSLDKSQQASSWGLRPLSDAQTAYAGADANVLTVLVDRIISSIAPPKMALASFPEDLLESLDISRAAKDAELWHSNPNLHSQDEKPGPSPDNGNGSADSANARRRLRRQRERTPRLPTTANEHSVNLRALQNFLGLQFPKSGRSIIMQVANADEGGQIPSAVPRYTRGGGIVVWKQAIMLFVNIDRYSGTSAYPNTFPEGGRKVVWFPAPGQSDKHPIIRRMLGLPVAEQHLNGSEHPQENQVLLFCRVRERRWLPFVFCGRLHRPEVDWDGGSNGVFRWALQDFDRLEKMEPFRHVVTAANEKLQPMTWKTAESIQ